MTDDDFQSTRGVPGEEDSPAELLEQAQSNAQAAIIATVAFLRDKDLPIAEWAASLGRTFARGWDEPQPWDADEFMEAMLINYRSLGATILSSDLGEDHAEATAADFPDPELCALFGVDLEHVAQFNDATAVIAGERGLTWRWELDGTRTRYTADRADQ